MIRHVNLIFPTFQNSLCNNLFSGRNKVVSEIVVVYKILFCNFICALITGDLVPVDPVLKFD